jgi:alcohol dehydrogenase class IV
MIPNNTIAWPALEKVVFGVPCAEAIRDEANNVGSQHVFLLASRTLSRKTDEISKVKKALGRRFAGLYDSMPAHSPIDAVIDAAALARKANTDLLVTIGGSSMTDAGKVMLICLKHGLTAADNLEPYHFYLDKTGELFSPDFEGPDIRSVAVPTTLSGGEFTAIAGAKNPAKKIKQGYQHRLLVPRTVILDPAVTVHTPDWLWFSTGIRALDHAIETIGSLVSNDFCDGIAENALKLLSEGLHRVKKNPTDRDGRLKCQFGMWQSMIPGVAGIPMGASHAVGHVLGGYLGVPHGYTSCIMAPHAMRFNESYNGDRQKRIAHAFGQQDRKASDVIDDLITDLGMPRTLRSVGVMPDQFKKIAEKCMQEPWIKTNPRPISKPEDIVEILKMAG